MRFPLLLISLCFCHNLHAQAKYNFSYRTENYTVLKNPTVLADNSQFNNAYFNLNLPFTWYYWGMPYTSVSFTSSIYCVAGPSGNYGFYPFYTTLKSLGNSQLGYILDASGGTGHRILKLEWKGAGFANDDTNTDICSIQVWIYEETSAVEIHFGNSNINTAHYKADFGNNGGPQVAFSDPQLHNYYNLKGDPKMPAAQMNPLTFIYLDGYPAEGMVYTFTPAQNTAIPAENFSNYSISIYPQPADDEIHISAGVTVNSQYHIYNMSGQCLASGILPAAHENTININALPAGVYTLTVENSTGFWRKTVIISR